MPERASRPENPREEIIESFLQTLADPLHKRIVGAYSPDNPVEEMEKELNRILEEIAADED